MRLQKENQKRWIRNVFERKLLSYFSLIGKTILYKARSLRCNFLSGLILIAAFFSVSGCKKPSTPSNEDYLNLAQQALQQRDAAIAKYGEAVRQYAFDTDIYSAFIAEFKNVINQLEGNLQQNNNIVTDYMLNIETMNQTLLLFSESVKKFLESNNPQYYKESKELFQRGKAQILKTENSLKTLAHTIYYSPYISKIEKQEKLKVIDDLKKALNLQGVLLEHQMLWETFNTVAEKTRQIAVAERNAASSLERAETARNQVISYYEALTQENAQFNMSTSPAVYQWDIMWAEEHVTDAKEALEATITAEDTTTAFDHAEEASIAARGAERILEFTIDKIARFHKVFTFDKNLAVPLNPNPDSPTVITIGQTPVIVLDPDDPFRSTPPLVGSHCYHFLLKFNDAFSDSNKRSYYPLVTTADVTQEAVCDSIGVCFCKYKFRDRNTVFYNRVSTWEVDRL